MNTFSRISCLVALGGLAAVLAGCASVGPDYEPPAFDDLPEAWSTPALPEVAEALSPTNGWLTLADPVLDDLLADVRARNCTLAAASATFDALAARYGASRAAYFPQLNAQGTVGLDRQTQWAHGAGVEVPDNPGGLYSLGLSMGWELDLWGRVRRSVEAARAEMDAGAEDVRDALISLQAQAALQYLVVRTAQARLQCARENIELQENTLKLAQDRFDAGLTGELDVRQGEMNLAATRASVPQLQASLEEALANLCVLTGHAPGGLEALREPASIPQPPDGAVPQSLPADVLRRRPDVRRAERQLAAQTAAIGIAKADLYPRLSLSGDFSFTSTDAGKFFTGDATDYTLGPALSWPIFSAGRIRNNIRAQEAQTRAVLATYRGTILSALAECETALANYASEHLRAAHLAEARDAARASVLLSEELYRSGLADFQNVLDMQRQLTSYEDALASSRGQLAAALVSILRAFAIAPPAP